MLNDLSLDKQVYKSTGEVTPIQIRVYDDKIMIANDCVFPEDWTVENLMKPHKSRPYNPLIAKGFYYRELFENWGRGIRLMVEECKNEGLREPLLSSNEYLVTTVFYRNDGDTSLHDKLQEKLQEKLQGKAGNLSETTGTGKDKKTRMTLKIKMFCVLLVIPTGKCKTFKK